MSDIYYKFFTRGDKVYKKPYRSIQNEDDTFTEMLVANVSVVGDGPEFEIDQATYENRLKEKAVLNAEKRNAEMEAGKKAMEKIDSAGVTVNDISMAIRYKNQLNK